MGWNGKPVQYNAENNWFYRANVITVDPVVYIVAENQNKFRKQAWWLKALSKSQNWPILHFFYLSLQILYSFGISRSLHSPLFFLRHCLAVLGL